MGVFALDMIGLLYDTLTMESQTTLTRKGETMNMAGRSMEAEIKSKARMMTREEIENWIEETSNTFVRLVLWEMLNV